MFKVTYMGRVYCAAAQMSLCQNICLDMGAVQYHGAARLRDVYRIAQDYDLVLTTYQTLGSDWHRVRPR